MGDKRKNEREALRGWAENGHEGKKTTKKNDEKKESLKREREEKNECMERYGLDE